MNILIIKETQTETTMTLKPSEWQKLKGVTTSNVGDDVEHPEISHIIG